MRYIARITAVAKGDLSQKITVDAQGEILELKNTVNTMVGQLSWFADQVTRVAREVGTDGKLGGQAEVKGVSGTWRDLTRGSDVMELVSPAGAHLSVPPRGDERPHDRLSTRELQVLDAVPVLQGAAAASIARTAGIPENEVVATLRRLSQQSLIEHSAGRWRLAAGQ